MNKRDLPTSNDTTAPQGIRGVTPIDAGNWLAGARVSARLAQYDKRMAQCRASVNEGEPGALDKQRRSRVD
jgi:hypothetical protein